MKYRNRPLAFLLCAGILLSLASPALAAAPQTGVRFEIPPTTITSPFAPALAAPAGVNTAVTLPTSIPLLVIVTQFAPSDGSAPATTYTSDGYLRWPHRFYDASKWSDMFFGASESIQDYYSVMSGGRFTFTPAPETDGANDGVVFVTIRQNHPSYDAKYDQWRAGEVYPGKGDETNSYVGFAVKAAMETAASCGYVDFSQFDTDSNGMIERTELIVYNIIAGYEDMNTQPADAPAIYAHQYTVSSATATYDAGTGEYTMGAPANVGTGGADLGLDNYMITGERYATEEGEYEPFVSPMYNIMAHELGHSLGLPDLYDTTTNPPPGPRVGSLSNMANCYGNTYDPANPDDAGKVIPTALDAWSRAYLGFQLPEDAQPNTLYTLHSLGSAEAYNILKIATASPDEYYLVENRQYAGYDTGLENEYLRAAAERGDTEYYQGGVVVWHIRDDIVGQYLGGNAVNVYTHEPGVMPVFLADDNAKPFRVNKNEHIFTFNYSRSQWGYLEIGSPSGVDMTVSYTLVDRDTPAPAETGRMWGGILPAQEEEAVPALPTIPATGDAPCLWVLPLLLGLVCLGASLLGVRRAGRAARG